MADHLQRRANDAAATELPQLLDRVIERLSFDIEPDSDDDLVIHDALGDALMIGVNLAVVEAAARALEAGAEAVFRLRLLKRGVPSDDDD